MRICLLSREYPPETGWGGIATFAYHLAHGLREIGPDVEVVSLSNDVDKGRNDDGIRIHRVSQGWAEGKFVALSMYLPTTRYVLLTSASLWRKFQELHSRDPFDVIDSPELLAEGIYPAVSRIAPRLVRLYTPHSKFIRERLNGVYSNFDHELVASMERVTMLSADVLTSPSQDLARYVAEDLNYDVNGIHIVRNPVDPSAFSPEGPSSGALGDRIGILFVGRLEERKGIEFLVRAIPRVVEKHRDVLFTIIGEDTENTKPRGSVLNRLKKILRQDNTGKYVRFITRVPLDELPRYYRAADISVVPSVYDNSPYSCLEAMSCGTPVIGTTSGGTAEYMVHDESGISIPPGNSAAIADAINALIESPVRRAAMGTHARQRVLAMFDRKTIASQTVELYHKAIEKHRLSSASPLYRKNAERLFDDSIFLASSFDEMIMEILWQHSPALRIRRIITLLAKQPGFFFSDASLRILHFLRVLPRSRFPPLNRLNDWLSEIREVGLEKQRQNPDAEN